MSENIDRAPSRAIPASFPKNQARNEKIIALRHMGLGPREIARKLGVSANVVAGVLFRAELTTEPRGRGHAVPDCVRDAILRSAEHMGVVAAAKAYGFNHVSVYAWRRERDVA